MHELSLLNSLLSKIEQMSAVENKTPIAIHLQLGPLAHISPAHLREHWQHAVAGTALASAALHIVELEDINHPHAQDMVLESLEFACDTMDDCSQEDREKNDD